jgi:ribosomal subunit interface protein
MDVTITARHCTISDIVRDRAVLRANRLERYDARVTRVDIVFDTDHGAKSVEGRLHLAGEGILTARGKANAFRSALDQVLDRLDKQLKRQCDRRRVRRIRTAVPAMAPAEEDFDT